MKKGDAGADINGKYIRIATGCSLCDFGEDANLRFVDVFFQRLKSDVGAEYREFPPV